MCEKCAELDAKIERYRKLSIGINDRHTLELIEALIDQLQAEKGALHPGGSGYDVQTLIGSNDSFREWHLQRSIEPLRGNVSPGRLRPKTPISEKPL